MNNEQLEIYVYCKENDFTKIMNSTHQSCDANYDNDKIANLLGFSTFYTSFTNIGFDIWMKSIEGLYEITLLYIPLNSHGISGFHVLVE